MGCSWICEAVFTLEMKRAPPFLCIGCVRKSVVLLHAPPRDGEGKYSLPDMEETGKRKGEMRCQDYFVTAHSYVCLKNRCSSHRDTVRGEEVSVS